MTAIQSTKLCECGCGQFTNLDCKSNPCRFRVGHATRRPVASRFWNKVNKTHSCWLWTGNKSKWSGYGFVKINGTRYFTHRISWQICNGDIPTGMCVLHHCDVRLCVNPDHLFLGTPTDNSNDKVSKGRQCKGSSHGLSKLSESQVLELLGSPAIPASFFSAKFGVSDRTIRNIRYNKSCWKHLKPEATA